MTVGHFVDQIVIDMIRAPVLLPRLRRAGIRGTAPPTAAAADSATRRQHPERMAKFKFVCTHGAQAPATWGRRRAANFGREAI